MDRLPAGTGRADCVVSITLNAMTIAAVVTITLNVVTLKGVQYKRKNVGKAP